MGRFMGRERAGFHAKLERLVKKTFDSRKSLEDLWAGKERDLMPGELHEFENTDRIPLSPSEALQMDAIARVDLTADLSRDSASPREKESNVATSPPDCNPLECKTGAKSIEEGLSQGRHDFITCEGCDRSTLSASGRILDSNLCLRCFETSDVDHTMIDPSYFGNPTYPFSFGHPTVEESMMDASSSEYLQSDSAETRLETSQAVAHEGFLPGNMGSLAKLKVLGPKDEKLEAAELL